MSFAPSLPTAPLARLRLLLLVPAVASAGVALVAGVAAAESLMTCVSIALMTFALVSHWAIGYRRGAFPLWAEPLEVAALFGLLQAVPGDPFLPLFGLVFRSMYGTLPLVLARYAIWMGALLGAHAPRGSVHFEEDLERVVGMVIAPGVMHTLSAALTRLEANERRLRSLVQNSTDIVSVVGDDLRVRWQADSMRSVLGHEPRRVVQTPLLDLVHEEDRRCLERYFEEARDRPGHAQTLTIRMRHADGSYRSVETVAANRLHDESVRGFVLNMRDATERLRLEGELRALASQLEHDSLHDPLTGLANRRQLFAHLEEAISTGCAEDEPLALLLVDLDHFKELNDTLGHRAGDLLLRELRPRLTAALTDAELVARIGGDEFAVLLKRGRGAAPARKAAQELLTAIQQPFDYQGLTLHVAASVGIAVYPEQAQDVETLVQRADVAMYGAKARGGGMEIYNASSDGHSRQRLALAGELPQAIKADQLVVQYQPQIHLETGRVAAAEALVRWDHPRYGLLGPDAFLPMAEQIGLMRSLTLHVLDRALADLAYWRQQGCEINVAVNLSKQNLIDLGLPSDVARLLDKWNVEASRLQLEVTETIIGADPVRVGEILTRLGQLGVTLSLDDFGTGSSSLSFLRQLPVDELKIDKSFVLGMEHDQEATAIVRTIVELAHDLGLKAVAEGVETDRARELLLESGCDFAQGFLLGRPISPDMLPALIHDTDALARDDGAMPGTRRLPVLG
jgi:diguanylate cyclase (GGDEF)-like protein/PAS domain S-box-containing protein